MQRYLRRFRHGRGHAPVPGPKRSTVREVTAWIMTHPDRLDPTDAEQLRQPANTTASWTASPAMSAGSPP